MKTDTCGAYTTVRSRSFINFSPSDKGESRASPQSDSSLAPIVCLLLLTDDELMKEKNKSRNNEIHC